MIASRVRPSWSELMALEDAVAWEVLSCLPLLDDGSGVILGAMAGVRR